jgi:hypothetical protein
VSYAFITKAQLRTQLAARLHDTSNVYWTSAELDLYLAEAQRTFGSLSAFWRDRGTVTLTQGTTYLDLPTQFPSLLSYTLLDRDLINICQYHLLEPATSVWGSGWTGTEMFQMSDLRNAIQNRRDQFLADTGMVVTQQYQTISTTPVNGRIPLPDKTIDVRRVIWITPTTLIHLWREDEFALNANDPNWFIDTAQPYAYSILASPPVTLQIAPPPSINYTSMTISDIEFFGQSQLINQVSSGVSVDTITVNSGATLNQQIGVALGIPDDWTWVIKWGALADLLGMDGPARDPVRAQFAEQRYQQGVQIAKQVSCIMQVQVAGVNLAIDPLVDVDAYDPNWQGNTQKTPTTIGTAGLNLAAIYPVPDTTYTFNFDLIVKAPVPVNDGDDVQLGREQVDMILDYAEHLAAFKMGGQEFLATVRHADNFLRESMAYNERLSAASRYITPDANQSVLETVSRPRRTPTKALVQELPDASQS